MPHAGKGTVHSIALSCLLPPPRASSIHITAVGTPAAVPQSSLAADRLAYKNSRPVLSLLHQRDFRLLEDVLRKVIETAKLREQMCEMIPNSNAAFWQLEKGTKGLPKVYLEQSVLKPRSTDGNSIYARSKRARIPKTAINSAHGRVLRGLQELEAGNLTDLEQLLSHKKMRNACKFLAKSLVELELDDQSRRQAQKDLASLQSKLRYLWAQAHTRISTASDWVLLHRQRVQATSQAPGAGLTESALRDLDRRLTNYVVDHGVGLSSDSWLDIGTPTM
ncbi:hypothetical protein IE81DRAFT_347595 [Ceraceosorus guamensis]|uniref:Uncharacterized protein n=1 Tax=Ceraceosorus guamensis TaxID=1522189 RepID=A0A316VYD6_9BASI|nr:hypothetical protein IE81DRAFT_347595 [Ceraceosorus guamensis]PWN42344.1 hypothetical protein IE81DRAFT_347595 [Ceraceosorus guamensis]